MASSVPFSFLGMVIIRNGPRLDTKVYVKPTDTGLLLHYQSHVDVKYKHSLLKTMLNRAFKLSSNWPFFHQECERLKMVFARLHYPKTLLLKWKVLKVCVLNNKTVSDERDARIRIVLPFKVQKSANALRHQLGDRSRKIDVKIKGQFKTKAQKPPLVNQQNVIYCAVCRLHDGVDTYINVWRNTSDQ